MSLNRIDIMGRLARDPEVRYTNNQKAVASFAVAVDRDGKDAGTDFVDVVAWEGTARMAESYFRKGDPVVVSGRLQIRPWEDKNGNKRTSAEIVADRLYFVPKVSAAPNATPNTAPTYSEMTAADDGELPF